VPNDQPRIANSDDPEAVVRDLLSQASEDLEPISPERALELYLEDKARDCRQSTVDYHRSRLDFLVRWCEDQGDREPERSDRPDEDTPVESRIPGERKVGISRGATAMIDDYPDQRKSVVTDRYRRNLPLATRHRRVAGSTTRIYVRGYCVNIAPSKTAALYPESSAVRVITGARE
jgi:hypothetical protein